MCVSVCLITHTYTQTHHHWDVVALKLLNSSELSVFSPLSTSLEATAAICGEITIGRVKGRRARSKMKVYV